MVDQREVVRQRILTLDGLLADPNGPFGQSGGDLAAKLAAGWRSERRLLRRILDETKADDVRATLQVWHERTAAFAEKAEDDDPNWRDRDGHVWHAREVLRLLDDFRRRLEAWIQEETDARGSNQGGGAGQSAIARPPRQAAADSSAQSPLSPEDAELAAEVRREAIAEGLHDELDDALDEAAEDERSYQSVLDRDAG
jgi:hypothetical protein